MQKGMDQCAMKYANIDKKLHSRAGFNLTETLMTVLLLTIVLGAITGGIAAAQRAYTKIRMKSDAQMLLSTTITEISAEFERARSLNGNEALPADNAEISAYYSEYRGGERVLINDTASTENKGIEIAIPKSDGSVDSAEPLANEKTRGLSTLYTKFVVNDANDQTPAAGTPIFMWDQGAANTSVTGYIEFTVAVFNHTAGGSDQMVARRTVKVRPTLCQ